MEVGIGMQVESGALAKLSTSGNLPSEKATAVRKRKLIIENRVGLFDVGWSELWEYRELLYALVGRELKLRYKQTAIGVSWVLLQPLVTMLIFTVIFGGLAKMPSDGVWYPVFALTALLPWTYFSQAVTRAGGALVSNANLVSKIYFPRILLPLSAVIAPLVDFVLSLGLLFGMLLYAGIPFTWKFLTLPIFILIAMISIHFLIQNGIYSIFTIGRVHQDLLCRNHRTWTKCLQ